MAPSTYPQWKAPSGDGEALIWPEPGALLAQTRRNHSALRGCEARVQGMPLGELRSQLRRWIGHADERLLIASGHQTELYHPGVWAKDALINAAAVKIDAEAYHIAVDTDQPKHLNVRWIVPAEGGPRVIDLPLSDDTRHETAPWSGLLDGPTPAHITMLTQRLGETPLGFEPMLGRFLGTLRRMSSETPGLSKAITNAQHELDWELGLRHHALIASPIWMSRPYLVFVYHILSRCRAFAAEYNAALAEYRRQQRIRTPSRPMPDLTLTESSCEAPFWLDRLGAEQRERASVWVEGDYQALVAPDGEELALEPALDAESAGRQLKGFLERHQLRLAPRALTLTFFVRLFVVDNFVHGIGGGQYDQVTDRLIASHFGIEPPGFAVTTATLYWPSAVGRTRVCQPCLAHEGHRLRHGLLGERKRELVVAIAAAPRRSLERRELFSQLHRELDEATLHNPVLEAWENRRREAEREAAEEAAIFNREIFYALQPRDRLEMLIERYRGAF